MDLLTGGAGADTLLGGSDADIFVFGADAAGSTDTILDFADTVDLLQIETGYSPYSVTDTTDGALIAMDNGLSILLNGILAADISDDDFLF